MRKSMFTATAALFAVIAAPAFAAEKAPPPPPSAPAPDATAPQAETVYCIKAEFTGSRLPKKICKTRANWIAQQDFDPLAPRQ
ncbi:hypothetical protein [Sphingomonas sp.]|jgi:hypothetical protein|uniref:hypothetical protein n=1 Tax=Sphingomonas sp. TaxID=28214 RepID=UPI00307E8F61